LGKSINKLHQHFDRYKKQKIEDNSLRQQELSNLMGAIIFTASNLLNNTNLKEKVSKKKILKRVPEE